MRCTTGDLSKVVAHCGDHKKDKFLEASLGKDFFPKDALTAVVKHHIFGKCRKTVDSGSHIVHNRSQAVARISTATAG